MRLLTVTALLSLSVIIGCATAHPKPVKLGPAPVETEALGPGDVFEVSVYDEPSMSRAFKVSPNGSINFPLVGEIAVEGKESQDVALILQDKLKEKRILKNPQVSVMVKEVNSKKFTVFGEVAHPGQFPLTPGLSIRQAISIAGGFTQLGDTDQVVLTRQVSKSKVIRVVLSVGDITDGRTPDVPLQSGDTIFVDRKVF